MTAPRPLRRAGGVFAPLHAALVGSLEALPPLDLAAHAPALVAEARATWLDRVHTEHRSAQALAGFLHDLLAAGDPVDVYAAALDLVGDEVRHVAACAALCRALDVVPTLPEVPPRDPRLAAAPPAERALHTALSLLVVQEALSVAFIEDLAARCETPAVAAVLRGTLGDEAGHAELGLAYVTASLGRFPARSRADWLGLVPRTLAPHEARVARILAEVPPDRRHLEAWPEPERAALGLFSPARQALVFRAARDRLEITLRARDLWPGG